MTMFDLKPDFDKTRQRMDAFWNGEVLDRPLTMFPLMKPPAEQRPLPESQHPDWQSYWMDIDFQAELALRSLHNQLFLGDTLPMSYPNLGPEAFSAFYGCPLHFGGEGTTWTDPILRDWGDVDRLVLDWDNQYLRWLLEMTDALLETGKGKFITGMPDWHSSGDAIAAFRDPQELALDMIEHEDELKALLVRLETDYFQLYNLFYDRLRAHQMPITSWLPLFDDGKYYIPSNDFSIMISKAMYDEVFLPGIVRECQFFDRSIYHLDGPGALRHLDSILSIAELDALQWVPGAGNEIYSRWVPVYQKAQQAGKGIYVTCTLDEIPQVMQTLDPRGLCLVVGGVPNPAAGEQLLRDLETWTSQKARKIAE
jgi:hypothetical protein